MKYSIALALWVCMYTASAQTDTITPEQAKLHIGTFKTVCGTVAGGAHIVKGKITYLNFDKDYPNQPFMAVIWDGDLKHFKPEPHVWLKGQRACVTGMLITYKGTPEIVLKESGQLGVKGGK